MRSDDEFSPEIESAFESYPQIRAGRDFDARFWSQLEARHGRYRGVLGLLRRLWELEIEGVVVWRLAASMISGGASCALVLGAVVEFSQPKSTPVVPLPPPQQIPSTMNAFAFYKRDWENEFLLPKPQPKAAPPRPAKKGGDFSWNGSNAHLA